MSQFRVIYGPTKGVAARFDCLANNSDEAIAKANAFFGNRIPQDVRVIAQSLEDWWKISTNPMNWKEGSFFLKLFNCTKWENVEVVNA